MSLLTVVAIIGALPLIFYIWAKWRQQYWTRKGIPQLEPNIVFGDYTAMITGKESLQKFFLDIYRNAKAAGMKHIGLYRGLYPEYMPLDTNQIKSILIKDFNYFTGHGIYHSPHDPLSMNLFNMEGSEWKNMRVKLTPIFTSGKIKMMFDIINNKTPALQKTISKHLDTDRPINIKDTLARFTTDVIASVAFGFECDSLNEPENKFREIGRLSFKTTFGKFLLESLFPYDLLGRLGYHSVPDIVEQYFTQVVRETIKYREQSNSNRNDFIQLMINLKNKGTIGNNDNTVDKDVKNFVTEQEVINEAFVFYLAGFETTSSTMTFALFELAQHLDLQDKLRKEILDTLAKYDGKLSYDAIMEMDYLDRVIKEALRKYPVVSIIPRECTKDYKLIDSDIVIEKGTKVDIPVIGLHMDPEYYPDPETFNPDNFSPENRAKRPDITWIPFGEGPRQCIGLRFGMMQSKIGIVSLLKDCRFTLDPTMKPPYLADNRSLVYSFKNDIMLRVSKV